MLVLYYKKKNASKMPVKGHQNPVLSNRHDSDIHVDLKTPFPIKKFSSVQKQHLEQHVYTPKAEITTLYISTSI